MLETYKSMNDQITPDPALIAKTAQLVQGSRRKGFKARPLYNKLCAIAAVFVLCLLLTTPVLAANVPSIYELMYLVSPGVAQFFKPVQVFCEDNGIRMEVVSTNIHENIAEIFVTLQDLTGDRVDETTDLFDSYSIHRAFSSSASCQRVGYDPKSKTATFLIQITEWGETIMDSKLTFSVREFLSHKVSLEHVLLGISLSGVDEAAQTQTINTSGKSSTSVSEKLMSANEFVVLNPGASICTPISGLDVTAIGYIGGMLHIQLATAQKLTLDNHGELYLVDKDGNRIPYDYSVSFVDGKDRSRMDYQEFVFRVSRDKIADYKLYGSFYTSGLRTEGRWQVTFPLVISDNSRVRNALGNLSL